MTNGARLLAQGISSEVVLNVDTGGDFNELKPVGQQREDAPLGDVKDRLRSTRSGCSGISSPQHPTSQFSKLFGSNAFAQ